MFKYFSFCLILAVAFLLLSFNFTNAQEIININTANSQELQTLPGIGPVLAGRIVDFRESNGNFSNIEDIMKVSGIAEGKFSDFKHIITIESGQSANQDGASTDVNYKNTSDDVSARLEVIRDQAVAIKTRVASMPDVSSGHVSEATTDNVARYQNSGDNGNTVEESEGAGEEAVQLASVNSSITVEKPDSLFKKLISWPAKVINWFK